MNFNLDKLKQKIAESNKAQGGKSTDFTPVGFIPKGTHHIRFFFDPTSDVLRTAVIHQIGKMKTICPKTIDPPQECHLCSIGKSLNTEDFLYKVPS